METRYHLPKKGKYLLGTLMGVGLLILFYGLFSQGISASRFWANILINNFFFLALGLGALFFLAVHIIGHSGWQVPVQRIPEAMGMTLPVAALLMFLFLPGMSDVYHWMHPSPEDEILVGKAPYLNLPFFLIRVVVYFVGWIFLAIKIGQLSIKGEVAQDLSAFRKKRIYAGLFIVFFAITSSTSAWDFLMSIDAHWFSTLYGWYTFSGLFVSAVAMIILLVLYLKREGMLPQVNEEHLHDLGKYLFAFSIFWAYLWFSQFMLIWYGNIPEETIYYVERITHLQGLFILNPLINFLAPFFLLMTRNSKRKPFWLGFTSFIVLLGHWLDFFLAVMPGVEGAEQVQVGILELGLPLFYLALFLMVFFFHLKKASLVPQNHPYYKESLDYENI